MWSQGGLPFRKVTGGAIASIRSTVRRRGFFTVKEIIVFINPSSYIIVIVLNRS